eukprot:2473878-Rhodomonas_salina.2
MLGWHLFFTCSPHALPQYRYTSVPLPPYALPQYRSPRMPYLSTAAPSGRRVGLGGSEAGSATHWRCWASVLAFSSDSSAPRPLAQYRASHSTCVAPYALPPPQPSALSLRHQPTTSAYSISLRHQPTVSAYDISLRYQPTTSAYGISLRHQPTTSAYASG